MTYYSQVSHEAFAKIKSGHRLIEPRLNDDAHKQIRVGDMLMLTNRDQPTQQLVAKVVGILRYPSFIEMFHLNDLSRFGSEDEGELLAEMHHYYTTEQEVHHGVLGLKLHLMKSVRV